MPQRIGRGGQISLDGEYHDGTGVLVDPVTPLVDIIDPASVTLVSNAVPVRDGVGLYHYNYLVAAEAPLGIWTAHWTGTINGVGVGADDLFEVTAAGGIEFDPGTLCTVEEVEGLAGVTLDSGQLTALNTLLADWTAELEERLNRPLTVRAYLGEKRTADGNGMIWPKHMPIVGLTEVRDANGVVVVSSAYQVGVGGGIDVGATMAGSVHFLDYTAGLDPDAARPVRSILLARAARLAVKMADNAFGVRALTQEGYNAPYLDEGWTDQELANVDRRRRRVAR